MRVPIFQVDAFASKIYTGNPAAICPLDAWLPDATLQAIAAENNLSETAFFVRDGDGFHLRWFTPRVEVELCGHATVAASFVLWEKLGWTGGSLRFRTLGGILTVTRQDGLFTLDFPARPPLEVPLNDAVGAALGRPPAVLLGARDYLAVYESEAEVRALQPDVAQLCRIDRFAVIVTAPGDSVDFVSRFFAPAKGVPEDPVTGSAHCTLTPYWSKRLGKTKMHARQISERGGELWVEDRGERVSIAGKAVLYLEGSIEV